LLEDAGCAAGRHRPLCARARPAKWNAGTIYSNL